MGHATKATRRALALYAADKSGRAKTALVKAIAKKAGIHEQTLWRAIRRNK